MLSKHSPPQFCHVEEICFNNMQISQWFPFVLRIKCKLLVLACKALSDLAPGLPLQADLRLSPRFTSVQSSKPQVPPSCQAP